MDWLEDDWWSDWGSDVLGAGLQLYNADQSRDAMNDSRSAIESGLAFDNPWAQHQPAMGAGLVELLANPGRITETPGYQFAYDQGLQALFAKQAATGQRLSGRAQTETMQFGQGLASQMYNQEMNRYASLAGANQATTGGLTAGQNLGQLGQQQSFNEGYLLNNLFSNYNNLLSGSDNQTSSQGPTYVNPGNPHAGGY